MSEANHSPLLYLILVPILVGSSSPWWWDKIASHFNHEAEQISNPIATPKTKVGPVNYRVRVKTASHENAGTDAGAFYIKLIGNEKISQDFVLNLKDTDDRRVGAEDTYTFTTHSDLGEIHEIEIRSNARTKGDDGWLFESAIVENLSTRQRWNFKCNKWIESDQNRNLEIIVKNNGDCE